MQNHLNSIPFKIAILCFALSLLDMPPMIRIQMTTFNYFFCGQWAFKYAHFWLRIIK